MTLQVYSVLLAFESTVMFSVKCCTPDVCAITTLLPLNHWIITLPKIEEQVILTISPIRKILLPVMEIAAIQMCVIVYLIQTFHSQLIFSDRVEFPLLLLIVQVKDPL